MKEKALTTARKKMNHKGTKSTKVKSKNKKYFVYFVSLRLILFPLCSL
jgi:hypothetical protein